MGILLGLLGAIAYGASDFIGGLASRRARALTVVVGSQFIGLLMALAALPFARGSGPSGRGLLWGAAAGLAGGAGVALLYRGLAVGHMSVIAPITAMLAAALPVLAGLALGERPSWAAALGVGVALVAIVLVSSAAAPPGGAADIGPREPLLHRPGLPEALGAGTAFGLFFVLLAQTGEGSAVWPLLASKAGSLALLLGGALLRRAPLRPPRGAGRLVVAAGVLDMAANASYLLSTRYGLLSLVAVLTSLYPAGTILLARLVLHERLTRVQIAGLVAAAAGAALITVG